MWRFLAMRAPVWAPEDGGGGGGQDGGAEGGDPPSWTPPDGIPKDYLGANADETLAKLAPAFGDLNTRFNGMREKLSGLPKAPDTPDGYEFTPSDKLKPYFGDMEKNPALSQARQAFHKHGIPASAFQGVIEDLYGPLIEGGHLPAPFDPKAELGAYQKAYGLDETALESELKQTETFAKGLTAQLKGVPEAMKEDVAQVMLGLTDSAAGNVFLKALSGRLLENGIRIAGEGAGAEMTESELKKLDADPRIDPKNRDHTDPNKRFDPDLRRRYDAAYAKLYPNTAD